MVTGDLGPSFSNVSSPGRYAKFLVLRPLVHIFSDIHVVHVAQTFQINRSSPVRYFHEVRRSTVSSSLDPDVRQAVSLPSFPVGSKS